MSNKKLPITLVESMYPESAQKARNFKASMMMMKKIHGLVEAGKISGTGPNFKGHDRPYLRFDRTDSPGVIRYHNLVVHVQQGPLNITTLKGEERRKAMEQRKKWMRRLIMDSKRNNRVILAICEGEDVIFLIPVQSKGGNSVYPCQLESYHLRELMHETETIFNRERRRR